MLTKARIPFKGILVFLLFGSKRIIVGDSNASIAEEILDVYTMNSILNE